MIIVYFLFWSFFAHMLFALFMGPSVLMNVSTSYAYLFQPEGLMMLLVGTGFGAVFALVLFCLTVISLALLLDKELDFVTAMLTSFATVRRNPRVMLVWGVVIAGLTFAALLPGFLGLFVVLPVLGPSTSRDTVGFVVDRAMNPVRFFVEPPESYYATAAGIGGALNTRYRFSDTIDELYYESADGYAAARILYLSNRRFELRGEAQDDYFDPYTDTYEDPYAQ